MEATREMESHAWDAAWCRRCESEVPLRDIEDGPPGPDEGSNWIHRYKIVTGTDTESAHDPNCMGDCERHGCPVPVPVPRVELEHCGPIVEAAWMGTAAGGAVLVDVETGEVLDARRDPNDREPFRVIDRGSAEWVLRHIFEAETEADAKRRRLRVLIENAEAEIRQHDREAQWFRDRFGAELEEWARRELEGAKRKSVQTPFGRVGWRRKKGRTIVHDHETAAVSVLGEDHPAVKTTHRVLVSQLEPDDVETLRGTIGPDGEPALVTVEEPYDSFYVDIGGGK